MIFTLDTEFIDTPTCSALLSLALVAEDGREMYVEFHYPDVEITPWLAQHVVPMLSGDKVTFEVARQMIHDFVGGSQWDVPMFWAYYGAYDWYWFCRVQGGFMEAPPFYPHRYREFAEFQQGVPNVSGPEHFALNDARSLMAALKKLTASRESPDNA